MQSLTRTCEGLKLTCLLCSVQIPPVHPVFVVVLGGVKVRVQTPLLLSVKPDTRKDRECIGPQGV